MRKHLDAYIIRKIEDLEDEIEKCRNTRNKGFGITGFYMLNGISLPAINAAYQYYTSGKLESYMDHFRENIIPFLPTEIIAGAGVLFGVNKIVKSNNKRRNYQSKIENLEGYLMGLTSD